MTENSQHHTPKKRTFAKFRVPLLAVALVLIVAFVTILIMKAVPAQQIDAGKYQVVYMTNGQAYFGKLQNTGGDFLVMKSPYIAQSVASGDDESSDSTQTTLLKVTDQVYGPEDSIAIKSSQVAFWQNLRDDSKVTKAIDSQK